MRKAVFTVTCALREWSNNKDAKGKTVWVVTDCPTVREENLRICPTVWLGAVGLTARTVRLLGKRKGTYTTYAAESRRQAIPQLPLLASSPAPGDEEIGRAHV